MRHASKLARLAIGGACAFLSACSHGILDPQGPVGIAEERILIASVGVMLSIVIPTIIAIAAFAWWFRESNHRARHLPTWAYSGRIELIVWSIPVLVILLLGGVTWIGSHQLDPAVPLTTSAAPLEIQVVALDWKWLFIYPRSKTASVNELFLPIQTPVHFSITSASVLNAFFIPQLGSMIYAMNGMTTQLNLQADEAGVFRGLSTHFSGDGFSDMHFQVHALSQADFAAWIAKAGSGDPLLDDDGYRALSRQSTNMPANYRLADPELFRRIASQALPPGPGPDDARAH